MEAESLENVISTQTNKGYRLSLSIWLRPLLQLHGFQKFNFFRYYSPVQMNIH